MANKNKMLLGMQRQIQADRQAFGNTAVKLVTSMALVVLHDTFGFGSTRLQRFQDAMESQAECITGEYCTLEELANLAEEMAGKVHLEDSKIESER